MQHDETDEIARRDECLKHLYDMLKAGNRLTEYVAGRTYAEYESNEMLRLSALSSGASQSCYRTAR